MSTGTVHRNNFDALRLIAALMVVVSHQFALMGRPAPMLNETYGLGALGVIIFFGISGFLVHQSWLRDPDLGRFLARRYLRILPALAVCMPLTLVAIKLSGLTGFPNNPLPNYNGSLWTIPLEVACYMALCGLCMLVRVRAPIFLLFAFLVWQYSGLRPVYGYYGVIFGMGMLLAEYERFRTSDWTLAFVVIGIAAAIMGMESAPFIFLVPTLAVWVGSRAWPVLRGIGAKGDISYGLYIYAWPVQQFGVALLGTDRTYLSMLVVTLAVLVPIACASWLFVEKPSLSAKPKSQGTLRPAA